MTDPTFGVQTVITLAALALSLLALFFIIRGAVLSALAEHYRRVQRARQKAPELTHLDVDGA